MSAFHRVDDIWSMPPARFFSLAWRLPCYRGVMRERVLAEQRDGEAARPAAQSQGQAPRGVSPRAPEPVTEAAVAADPDVLGRLFSFG